jgi:3-isopropylmalate/(R)-2-methylmalate dehydratase small subunit
VTTPSGQVFSFDITGHRKHCLLNGLDEISLTLQHADAIKAFEVQRKIEQPWLFS